MQHCDWKAKGASYDAQKLLVAESANSTLLVYARWGCLCTRDGAACVRTLGLLVYARLHCLCMRTGAACVRAMVLLVYACWRCLCTRCVRQPAKYQQFKFLVYTLCTPCVCLMYSSLQNPSSSNS